MAKKFFSRKLSLACTIEPDLDPSQQDTPSLNPELQSGPITVQPGRSMGKESPIQSTPQAPPACDLESSHNQYVLKPIDFNPDLEARKKRILSFVAQEKLKRSSYQPNEIVMQWYHRDIRQVRKAQCELSVATVATSKKELAPHVIDCESITELSDSDDSHPSAINLDSDEPKDILPLLPDFTSYVKDPEVDLVALNLSSLDRERTRAAISDMPQQTPRRSLGQCLPRNIRDKVWPSTSDSDNHPTSSTDTSDIDKHMLSTLKGSMSHNLNVLKRKPLTQSRLSELREKVRVDMGRITLTEPVLKRPKIEPSDTPQSEHAYDLSEFIGQQIKRLRVASDLSNEDPSPVKKRPKIESPIQTEAPQFRGDHSEELTSAPRVIRSARRRVTPPSHSEDLTIDPSTNWPASVSVETPQHVKEERVDVGDNRIVLKATRKNTTVRRCRLCGDTNRNQRSHVVITHLGSTWWGVVGDLTCWSCQRYHTPSDITRCEGTYIPLFHFSTLISRHKDFVAYLMEELGVANTIDLVKKVKELGLNSKCGSDFTDREITFLETIDTYYGNDKKKRYSARYPTRVVELLHWKTLCEIFIYIKATGNLSGSQYSTHSASFVDARCDIITFKTQQNHDGLLSTMPLIEKDLRSSKLGKIIGEIHDPTVAIETPMLLLKDPLLRLALGVSPQHAHHVKAGYYVFCQHKIKDNGVVAIGGLGIDSRVLTASIAKQEEVMTIFLELAKNSNKAVRLFSTGDLGHTISIAQKELLKKHPLHLLNYNGGPKEIQEFLNYFPNAFIGISSKVTDPNPDLLRTIQLTPVTRLIVESNCPHQSITYHTRARPTDVVTVMNTIARIKHLNPNLVSRIIRTNITRLYHF